VRTPTKQFFYRRPAGDGSWTLGLGNVRMVLYGLSLLREINWTFSVEGEKDVEALWSIGLPATTNPEGAGPGKWRRSYCQQLAKAGVRRVYVIPDNDAVGREHAREVVTRCREHGIRARLLALPGLPPKGDVSDYLAAGHGRRDLLRLVRQSGGSK
jgi:DNA primase